MTTAWRAPAAALVADLQHVFGERLRSVVAYGPRIDGDEEAHLTCLALVSSLGSSDLQACAARSRHWTRTGIATPLILPEDEFRRSLDAFPLEYGEIIRAHERVFGDDPFVESVISPEDLRRACETQVKSHLVHLREGYIEAGGRPHDIGQLVAASAPAFGALLRNVARLSGVNITDRAEASLQGARLAGLPDDLVRGVLAFERRSGVPATDPARLFPDYLHAVERLARTVDAWRN